MTKKLKTLISVRRSLAGWLGLCVFVREGAVLSHPQPPRGSSDGDDVMVPDGCWHWEDCLLMSFNTYYIIIIIMWIWKSKMSISGREEFPMEVWWTIIQSRDTSREDSTTFFG